MAIYRPNTTKCVFKWLKQHQKVPKFNKITISTLSDTPLGPIRILEIKNIHNKEFFLSTCDDPPPPYPQNVDNVPDFILTPTLCEMCYIFV